MMHRVFKSICLAHLSLILCVPTWGCASAKARAPVAQERQCPPGTHFYGDGMVATRMPQDALDALTLAHERAIDAAQDARSPFLADQPYAPHVSVIYGITPDKALPAITAMQAYLHDQTACTMSFGELHYWDDAVGNKTTLVVDVSEPAGLLTGLHNRLAEAAQVGSRFAYHPHLTLLYLNLGARLTPAQEAAVREPLAPMRWSAREFYVTDPCGQTLHRTVL